MKSSVALSSPKYLKKLGQEAVDNTMMDSGRATSSAPSRARTDSSALRANHDDNPVLLRIRASRLVDLFPDELLVQEKCISIIRNSLLVHSTETLPMKDVGRVVLVDTPWFDGIRIFGKNVAHDLHIGGLNKFKARWAKEVIESLLLEEREGNDRAPKALRIDMPPYASESPDTDERRPHA
jgi:hypothetical protein